MSERKDNVIQLKIDLATVMMCLTIHLLAVFHTQMTLFICSLILLMWPN